MTMQLRYHIHDREARASLRALDAAAKGPVLLKALLPGARRLALRMKSLARVRTSRLRRSVHVGGYPEFTPEFDPSEGYSDIGGSRQDERSAHLDVGTNLFYAWFEEYGTSKQAAHAFARPAGDTADAAIETDIMRELDALLGVV